VLSTRKSPGSSTVHLRAIVAATLALALTLALAASASAAPSVTIDSGPDGPTRDTMPLFAFTTDVDATTECSIVPDQVAPVYVPCSGTFLPDTPLADGAYVFWVRATDALLDQTEKSQPFTVDTTTPSLSIDSGPPGLTNDRTPSFGFTTDAERVECSVDDGTPVYGSCSTATSHTAAALADGSYVFHVRATDAAGNQTEKASQGFTVDTVAPVVGLTSGPAGPTNNPLPSFGFTVDLSAVTVECSIDQGSSAYVPCAATYAPAAPLADGRYTFRVRATDAAGNQSRPAQQAFSVDSEAPSLSIDSGPAGPTNVITPSFGFTVEPGASVKCSLDHGMPAYGSCTSATTYALGAPLSEGRYVFRVRATDDGGNDHIELRIFTVDTTPPTLSISFGPSGTTSDSTPLFGFAVEVGAMVECSIDQGAPAYGPCASATTNAAVAPLADGAYVFRARATDAAGNQTSVTRAFTVSTVSQSPRPAPTQPAAPAPASRLLSPFPLVRISGTLTATGARLRVLSVRASPGTLVRVTVRPACAAKRRSARRCRVIHAAGTVGRHAVIGFRRLARAYRGGTVIVVRVWRADRIGKYTRFTIMRGKAPRRVDQCLVPGATRGSRCPSA